MYGLPLAQHAPASGFPEVSMRVGRTFHLCTSHLIAAMLLWASGEPRLAIAQDAPGTAVEREFSDGASWTMVEPLIWRIGASGVAVVVPKGFVHDKASIPRVLHPFLPKNGRYSRAAVIHDFLYWTQRCSRLEADNLFMIAMKESGVSTFDAWTIYRAVRWAGGSAWNENRREARNGELRFNAYEGDTGNLTWAQVRGLLKEAGSRDPPIEIDPAHCWLGRSTEIP